MKKIVALFIIILCHSITTLFAQSGSVEVVGAKGDYITYRTLESKSVLKMVSPITEKITIDNINPNLVYMIGINSKVVFFQPAVNGTVKIDATKEKFVISGDNKEVNNYLDQLCWNYFYSINNPQIADYLGQLTLSVFPEFNAEYVNSDQFPKDLLAIKENSQRDLKIENKMLETNVSKLIEELYWESVFYGYAMLRKKDIEGNKELINLIVGYDMNTPDFSTNKYRDMRIYQYLNAQEDLGELVTTEDNFIAQKATFIKNAELREQWIFAEAGRFKGNSSVLAQMLIACEPLFVSPKGKEVLAGKVRALSGTSSKKNFDGVAAQELIGEDSSGKIVKLSDFKGKYVYLDLWATWCGPCKAEIPSLMKLEEELKGKDIVFMSVSIDKQANKEAWKQFLVDNKMHGVNLIAPSDFSTPFVSYYRVKAIPRFMLIGPDGKMYSNDYLRPRDPKLKDQLLKLLDKK